MYDSVLLSESLHTPCSLHAQTRTFSFLHFCFPPFLVKPISLSCQTVFSEINTTLLSGLTVVISSSGSYESALGVVQYDIILYISFFSFLPYALITFCYVRL